MFVVDTNVLVYAVDSDSAMHERCRRLVEGWRSGPQAWFLTWGIVYEFLRVTTHPKVFRRPLTVDQAWRVMDALLRSGSLSVLTATSRHAEVASGVFADIPHLQGNILHDAATAILMREHGVSKIVTRDTDFQRFPFVESIDPALTSPS